MVAQTPTNAPPLAEKETGRGETEGIMLSSELGSCRGLSEGSKVLRFWRKGQDHPLVVSAAKHRVAGRLTASDKAIPPRARLLILPVRRQHPDT